MKLLRSFPILSFTLVLLAISALCVAMDSIGLLLVALTVAAISWYMTEGPRGRVLPRWVSNIMVVAFTLWVLMELFQNPHQLLKTLGFYAIMLTLVKLYERRSARDYAHLLTLSLVLMMTACLQSNNLVVGAMLVLYAALGLYVLLLYQLYWAFEHARQERAAIIPADYRLIPPLKPIMGRQTVLRLRGQAFTIAIAGVLLSVMVFVAYPRGIGADMLRLPNAIPQARISKFSWNVDLNAGGRINESHVPVMSVQLQSAAGEPMRLQSPLYLRGAVLDQYQSTGRWVSNTQPLAFDALNNGGRVVPEIDISDRAITQRITLHQPVDGEMPIFSMYAPVQAQVVATTTVVRYDFINQTLRTEDHTRRVRSYTVTAEPNLDETQAAKVTRRARPNVRPRWFTNDVLTLRQLADDQLAMAGVAVQPPQTLPERWEWNGKVASALTKWLQSSAFTYTLDLSSVVSGREELDPIVRFLTMTKRGHCEYFASGLAALLHSKGIPARLVAGYVSTEYNDTLNQYEVLERDAHAWVEVAAGESNGFLWTLFDPTPAAAITNRAPQATTFADQMRTMYQRWEGNWSNTVVHYNSGAQSQLMESLNQSWSGRISRSLESVKEWMQRVNAAFYLGPAGYIWMGIVGCALVIAVIALVKLMRRSMLIRRTLQLQHVRGAEYQRMLRHLGFYVDMLDVLRRAGIAKPDWQPPLQFAQALEARSRPAAVLVKDLAHTFYAARYGHESLEGDTVQAAQHKVRDLAALLRVRWRRK